MYVKVITSQTLPHYCLGPGSEYLNRDAPFSTSVSTLIDATFPTFFTPIFFGDCGSKEDCPSTGVSILRCPRIELRSELLFLKVI